jgi:ribonuclease HI
LNRQVIEIYTDGSCNTNFNIGAWVAILFVSDKKIVLKGEAQDTTHNRMELIAAIKAIEFVNSNYKNTPLKIYTDSQYLSRLPERRERLKKKLFNTNKGIPLQNSDLVKILTCQIENHSIEFIKVKAHQKSVAGYSNPFVDFNIEVDKLARKMVREAVKRHAVDEISDYSVPK